MTNKRAKFKCLKCNREYESDVKVTTCPKCYHVYVKWVNYEEICGKTKKNKKIKTSK